MRHNDKLLAAALFAAQPDPHADQSAWTAWFTCVVQVSLALQNANPNFPTAAFRFAAHHYDIADKGIEPQSPAAWELRNVGHT